MIDALPAAPDPASDAPAVFSQKAAALVLAMKTMVAQINATTANLGSFAAGGAFALSYIFTGATVNGALNTPGAASQSVATGLTVWNTTPGGVSVLPLLQQLDASTSLVKGFMRIQSVSDPSKWLVFNVTGRTDGGSYQVFTGTMAGASSANPFVNGEALMVFFTRNGDAGVAQTLFVRDEKSNGTSPQVMGNGWNRRTLNRVLQNSIPGASLGSVSANAFTLQPGGYWLEASAPARNPSNHQLRLYNMTNNTVYDVGCSGFANSGSDTTANVGVAVIRTYITITTATTFAIDHYISGNNVAGGAASGSGYVEVYTDVKITKVA